MANLTLSVEEETVERAREAECDRLMEHVRFLAHVDRGLADSDADRVVAHDVVTDELKQRYSRRKAR